MMDDEREAEVTDTLARLQELWPALSFEGDGRHLVCVLLDYADGDAILRNAKALIADCRETDERPPTAAQWLRDEIDRLDEASRLLVPDL